MLLIAKDSMTLSVGLVGQQVAGERRDELPERNSQSAVGGRNYPDG